MIAARIRKSFPQKEATRAFSLDVDLRSSAGLAVLFGSSGSGKTLTLDCIAGLACPDAGRIVLDDRILFDAEAGLHLEPRARHIGYVFQNYALFPHMTLRQNLAFAIERLPRLERTRRVDDMLRRFRLTDVAGLRPAQLSGGQKQRCSIARALIGEPRLLLLDEPARGLDPLLRAEFYDVLRQVRSEFGTPGLLVTHNLDECFELGDEMFVMREGRIAQSGPPRKILDAPTNLDVARLMNRYNLMPVEILALDPGRNTSRLRYESFDIAGPYFPGHLLGDRVWLCTRPEKLRAGPRLGEVARNQIPATLARCIERQRDRRLEFAGGIAVEQPLSEPCARAGQDWVIEFPPESLMLL